MGYVKGITNVFIENSRESQEETKHDLCTKIFEEIKNIQKAQKKYNEKDSYSLSMISGLQGRQKLRQECISLGIGHLGITKKLMNIESENFLKRQLLIKQRCYINVYVIDAYNLASRDMGSASDPYIHAVLGKHEFSNRDEYQEDKE